MSIKFAIRNTASKASKEGDAFIRYSGTGEPFSRNCERTSIATEMDAQGTPTKWVVVIEYLQGFTSGSMTKKRK